MQQILILSGLVYVYFLYDGLDIGQRNNIYNIVYRTFVFWFLVHMPVFTLFNKNFSKHTCPFIYYNLYIWF